MTETIPTTTPSLSKEEQAFLMKALWEALQMPPWNRDDLIDLGKLIFAKKSLFARFAVSAESLAR